MNFGQNILTWLTTNAQSLVLVGIVVMGVYLIIKREMTKLIGFLLISAVAVGIVYNTAGVKDLLLNLFNMVIGG
ncbi:multisubunit Na+/H+ antiporter MnhC subunit [Lachnospiraceae bacterium PH1-22]